MDTDNSVEKAWGGVGARRKGVKEGGNWGASVILSIKIKKKKNSNQETSEAGSPM